MAKLTRKDRVNLVRQAFQDLLNALEKFSLSLESDDNLPGWVDGSHEPLLEFPSNPRKAAVIAFLQLTFLEGQEPKETIVLPGVLAASRKTIDLAHDVNKEKSKFKNVMTRLKQENGQTLEATIKSMLFEEYRKRDYVRKTVLKSISLSRLSLKQSYRKITILDECPSRIGWTWANTRGVKVVTVEEARHMLLKYEDDAGIRAQLGKLDTLPNDEKLAIVQDLAPHLRANLVFQNNDGSIKRKQVKAALPLLYPWLPEETFPTLPAKGVPEKKGKSERRLQRSDRKIEDEVFLPAIRAHRYARSPSEI